MLWSESPLFRLSISPKLLVLMLERMNLVCEKPSTAVSGRLVPRLLKPVKVKLLKHLEVALDNLSVLRVHHYELVLINAYSL